MGAALSLCFVAEDDEAFDAGVNLIDPSLDQSELKTTDNNTPLPFYLTSQEPVLVFAPDIFIEIRPGVFRLMPSVEVRDPGSVDECKICLLEKKKEEFETIAGCGHSYCSVCLTRWYKVKKQCPGCKFMFHPGLMSSSLPISKSPNQDMTRSM